MADPYRSHYANGEAVDAALDSGVAAQSEVAGARGSYGNLNARLSAVETSLSNKANSNNVYTKTQVDNALENKVSKENGKGLSTNDFTNIEKTKLEGLQNYDDSALSGRVTTVEQSIATLNGGASTSGSVANSVASGVQTSKDYTDTEIKKLDSSAVGGNGKYIKSISQTDGKITAVEETMDTTPTASSTKAITSGAVHAAMTTETTAREAADKKHDAALVELIDSGDKNVFTTAASTQTVTDVTFTKNSDGTWTVNGTAADRRQKALAFTVPATLESGTYVLSGCPSGAVSGSTILYCLYLLDTTANVRISQNDTGTGIEFDWTPDSTHQYQIVVDIRSGTTADNLLFKPMICTKVSKDISDEYVQHRTNWDEIQNSSLAALIDSGAKNTIDLSSIPSQTISGITWTVDADNGTVTANGTATADSFFFIVPRDSNIEYANPTVLSGCPAGGSQSIYEIQAQIGSTSYRDFGNSVNIPAGVIRYVAIAIRKNQVADNMVFYPMLCDEAAYTISNAHVPYRPSWSKMWDMIKALQS